MHQAAGRGQPGKAQPPSRTARAAHWAGVTVRFARPTSSGMPAGSVMIRVISASQPSRRAVAADIGPPKASTAGCIPRSPALASRVSRSRITLTCGRTVCPSGRFPPFRARRANSTSASARRWPAERRSLPSVFASGHRRGQRVQGGPDDGGGFGVQLPADPGGAVTQVIQVQFAPVISPLLALLQGVRIQQMHQRLTQAGHLGRVVLAGPTRQLTLGGLHLLRIQAGRHARPWCSLPPWRVRPRPRPRPAPRRWPASTTTHAAHLTGWRPNRIGPSRGGGSHRFASSTRDPRLARPQPQPVPAATPRWTGRPGGGPDPGRRPRGPAANRVRPAGPPAPPTGPAPRPGRHRTAPTPPRPPSRPGCRTTSPSAAVTG